VAPDLSVIVRELLQRRCVSVASQSVYLEGLKSISRYQSAFNKLWEQCANSGLSPLELSLDEIAGQLCLLAATSLSQARSAYSALLLLPGFEGLKFNILLRKVKQQWSVSQPAYPAFWDSSPVIKQLASAPLDWNSVEHIRTRLILCWRLFALFRSVDLQRLYRQVSFIDKRPFVWVKRKGWNKPRWEEIIVLPQKEICPWKFLQRYV